MRHENHPGTWEIHLNFHHTIRNINSIRSPSVFPAIQLFCIVPGCHDLPSLCSDKDLLFLLSFQVCEPDRRYLKNISPAFLYHSKNAALAILHSYNTKESQMDD